MGQSLSSTGPSCLVLAIIEVSEVTLCSFLWKVIRFEHFFIVPHWGKALAEEFLAVRVRPGSSRQGLCLLTF